MDIKVTPQESKKFRSKLSGEIADLLMKLKSSDAYESAHTVADEIRIRLVKFEHSFSNSFPEEWNEEGPVIEAIPASVDEKKLNDSKTISPAKP